MALPSGELTRILVGRREVGSLLGPLGQGDYYAREAFLPARPNDTDWSIAVNHGVLDAGFSSHIADIVCRAFRVPAEGIGQLERPNYDWCQVPSLPSVTFTIEDTLSSRQWQQWAHGMFDLDTPPIPEDVLKRYEAGERAQELLCQHLTPQQCEDRGDLGYFWVETAGRKFCIGCDADFVEEHDRAGKLASYCLQTFEYGLPREDKILAVLLMLRHTPDKFFSEANVIWHREDSRVDLVSNQWRPPPEVCRPRSTYREWYDKHYHQQKG